MKELTDQELKNLGGYSGRGNVVGRFATPQRHGHVELVGRYATPQRYGNVQLVGSRYATPTHYGDVTLVGAMSLKDAKVIQVSTLQNIAKLIDAKKVIPAKMVAKFVAARSLLYKEREKEDASIEMKKRWANQLQRIVKTAGGTIKGKVVLSKSSGFYEGNIGFYQSNIGFLGWVKKAIGWTVDKTLKLGEGVIRGAAGAVGGLVTGGLGGMASGAWKGFAKPWKGKKKKVDPRNMQPGRLQQVPSNIANRLWQQQNQRQLAQMQVRRPMQRPRRLPLRYNPSEPMTVMPSVSVMARQIAERKHFAKAKQKDLASRLEVATRRKQLAEMEMAERDALDRLETKAAQAEAEAAMLEAEMKIMDEGEIGGATVQKYFPAESPSASSILGKALDLRDQADQARVAKAVIKNAAPLAKALFVNSPLGALFNFARKIYQDATADPKGQKKVAKIKAEEKKGSTEAAKVMTILRAGKLVDTEVKAAKTVQRELNKKVAEKRSGDAVVGALLPSNVRVLSVVPGAKKIYLLAKQGNPTMISLIKKSADLIRRWESGDAAAGGLIEKFKSASREGDKKAQIMMGALAVAAAGIREEKRHKQEQMKKKAAAWDKEHLSDLIRIEGAIEDPELKADLHKAISVYKGALAEGVAATKSGDHVLRQQAGDKIAATGKHVQSKIEEIPDAGTQRSVRLLLEQYTRPISKLLRKLTGAKTYGEGLAIKLKLK